MANEFEKTDEEVLDYLVDFTDLLAVGESITGTPTVTVPSPLNKNSQSNTATVVTVWISGGAIDTQYPIEVTVVTSSGRTYSRYFLLKVVERRI